jgi:hypothetical protein
MLHQASGRVRFSVRSHRKRGSQRSAESSRGSGSGSLTGCSGFLQHTGKVDRVGYRTRAVPTGFRLRGGCIPKFGPPSIPGPPQKIFSGKQKFVRKMLATGGEVDVIFSKTKAKQLFSRNFQNFQRRPL